MRRDYRLNGADEEVVCPERVDSVTNIRVGVRAPSTFPGDPFEPSIAAVLVERKSGRHTLFCTEDPLETLVFLSQLPQNDPRRRNS